MAGVRETPNTLQYSIEACSLQREWSPVLSVLFWASSRTYSSWLCLFFLASLICHGSCLPTPQEGKLHPVKRVETRISTGVQPHHVLSLLPFALQTEAISPGNSSLLESEPTYLYCCPLGHFCGCIHPGKLSLVSDPSHDLQLGSLYPALLLPYFTLQSERQKENACQG